MDNCQTIPFYNCVGELVKYANFSSCPKRCLKESMKIIGDNNLTDFPTCSTPEESDCSEMFLFKDVLGNATNGSCPKSCVIREYGGGIDYVIPKRGSDFPENAFILAYRFAAPFAMPSYQEYLIYDFNGLVGSVGGTLGIFIGFNFYDIIARFFEYLKTK